MFKLKKWKTNLTIFLLTFVMLSNTLLGDWDGVVTVTAASVVVESLSMMPEKQILYLNDSEILEVTINPEDAADKTLTWSSSDESIATVTADTSDSTKATVTGVAAGETTITATSSNGKTATCVVSVKEAGLLPNGDFERKTGSISATEISTKKLIAGEAAAWYGCNSGTYLTTDVDQAIVDVLYSISTEEGYDGGNVLKIHKGNVDANAEVNRAWVRQELALEPNTTYTLSAQVKPVGMTTVNEVNNTKYPLIQLIVADNGSAKSEHSVSSAEKDNAWKDLELEFTTDDATNTKKTRVAINVYRLESGYCLIDNVVLTKVVAQIEEGEKYATLAEAISAASAGETIEVVGDATLTANVTSNANIIINSGVTLDLNGCILDMGNNYLYSFGDLVDNSTGKTGRLVVGTYAEGEKDDVPEGTPKGTLAEANSQMPVYIADKGYMFATMKGQGNVTEQTADDFTVDFRPSFGSAYSILAAGAEAAKLEFIVRLDWTDEGKNYYQLFKCSDDLVKTIYGQNKIFRVTFNGLTGYKEGMKVTVHVKSDLGVDWLNNSYQMTKTSNE